MYTFDDIIPVMIYDGKLKINFADIKRQINLSMQHCTPQLTLSLL